MCFSYIIVVDMAFIGLLKALLRNIEERVLTLFAFKYSLLSPLSVVLSQPACGLTHAFEEPSMWGEGAEGLGWPVSAVFHHCFH